MHDAFDKHWRWLALAVVLAFVFVVSRQYRGDPGPGTGLRRVDLAELERATAGEPFLLYRGLDRRGHRFATLDGRSFLAPRDALTVPSTLPASAGGALFVTIRDGRVRAPDPAALREWSRRQGLDAPEDEPLAADPAPRPPPR